MTNKEAVQPDVRDTNVGDMISRQAAIDFIDAGHLVNPNEPRWSDNEVVNFLKSRPSAQPERCSDCIAHGGDWECDHMHCRKGRLPSAQSERTEERTETHACDTISRQAAIDAEGLDEQIRCEMCRNPMHTDRGCDGNCKYDEKLYERIMQILDERIKPLPPAQPEPRWIPVSERLPEPRVDVWVNSDIGQIQGYYEEHINVWYASFGQGRDYLELIVNAWRPLPEPYGGEQG